MKRFDKQALKTVLNNNLDYETVLKIIGSVNLKSSLVQNMLVTTYKTLYGIALKNEKQRTTSEVS